MAFERHFNRFSSSDKTAAFPLGRGPAIAPDQVGFSDRGHVSLAAQAFDFPAFIRLARSLLKLNAVQGELLFKQ